MFVRAHVKRFLNRGFDNFRSVLSVADDRVVVHYELFASDLGLEYLRALFNLIAVANSLIFASPRIT